MRPAPDALCVRFPRARTSALLSPCLVLFALLVPFPSFAADADAANLPLPAPPVLEAGEVSVTATRGERSVLDVAANVTVIDRAEIERSGAANLPELLRREAGLFVTNTTTNAEGYSVEARGFLNGGGNGCRTLVLVDGRRVNEPDSGCPDWTFLSLANVERIEVIRGPASAVYGDNALGGVIEIFTRSAAESEAGSARGALHAEASSFDSERADAFAAWDFGGIGASLVARSDDTAGYRDQAGLENHGAELGLDAELGALGSVRVSGGFASSDRSRPGALFEPFDDRTSASRVRDFGVERERFVQAALELALPAEIALRALPFYRHSQAENDFVLPGFSFPRSSDDSMTGLDVQLRRDFSFAGMALRAIGGGELRRDEIEAASGSGAFAVANDAERDVFALFLQLEAALDDDLLLSLGVRRDDSELEGSSASGGFASDFEADHAVWSPRASLAWRFREDASAWLSYSRGFRFPNLDETFGSFGFSPALDPERSQGGELGARFEGERAQLLGTLYWMEVEDEIFFDPFAPNGPSPFLGINDNVDRVRHRGIELSGSVELAEPVQLIASYSFDDVRVLEDRVPALDGERMPLTPRHRAGLELRAALPYGVEGSVRGNFVGSRRIANDVQGAQAELPSHLTLDARLALRHDLGRSTSVLVELFGRNLGDHAYEEFAGFSSFSGAVGFYPAPGRSFGVGVRLEYGP